KKDMGNTASNLGQKAQEAGSDAVNRVKDLASNVSQKASDTASLVGKKADDTAAAMGSGMKSLSETIRERGPSSGFGSSATSAVADTLESGGRYLEEHGVCGIGKDLTTLIRRNPIPAILIGVGAGFLLARATTRR